MRRQGLRALLVAVGLLLVASGCQVQLDVDVTMAEDGSGTAAVTLRLDPDALEQVGGDIGSVVDLDRLADQGWTVGTPTTDDTGATTLVVDQDFDDPDDVGGIVSSLSGERGPFREFRLERSSSFLDERWQFAGTVDLTGGGDAPVVDGGGAEPPAAIDDAAVAALAEQLGESFDRLVQVRVRVRLPGDVTSNATTRADNGAVWAIRPGEGLLELRAEGTERRTSNLVLLGAAVLLLVVGLLALLLRLAVLRVDRSRTRSD